MNRIRIYTNILLGACISLLVGCNAQKKATKGQQAVAEEPQDEVVSQPDVICLYGVPPEVYEQYSDTTNQDTDKRDDVDFQQE